MMGSRFGSRFKSYSRGVELDNLDRNRGDDSTNAAAQTVGWGGHDGNDNPGAVIGGDAESRRAEAVKQMKLRKLQNISIINRVTILDDYSAPEWNNSLEHILSCLESAVAYGVLAATLDTLKELDGLR